VLAEVPDGRGRQEAFADLRHGDVVVHQRSEHRRDDARRAGGRGGHDDVAAGVLFAHGEAVGGHPGDGLAGGALAGFLQVPHHLRRLAVQLDGAGQDAFHRQAGVDAAEHDLDHLVQEFPDLLLGFPGDGQLVLEQDLLQRYLAVQRVLLELLGMGVRVLGLPLFRRLVALPLDEAAADRVVFQRVQRLVARQQHGGHGVGMMEVALGGVEDDVLEGQIEAGRSDGDRVRLVRVGRQLVEELRRAGGRRLAEQAGQRGPVGAVALARGAEAPVEVHLQGGGFLQLLGRELGDPLEEVVGDPHGPHGVGARGTRPHLVELLEHRHDRPLLLLDHVERGVERGRLAARGRRRLLGHGAAQEKRPDGSRRDGAAELAPVEPDQTACLSRGGWTGGAARRDAAITRIPLRVDRFERLSHGTISFSVD